MGPHFNRQEVMEIPIDVFCDIVSDQLLHTLHTGPQRVEGGTDIHMQIALLHDRVSRWQQATGQTTEWQTACRARRGIPPPEQEEELAEGAFPHLGSEDDEAEPDGQNEGLASSPTRGARDC